MSEKFKMSTLSIILGCFLFFNSCSKRDDTIDVVGEERLNQELTRIAEESDLPGFTIGVIKEGQIAYQKSFGFQNLENNLPYNNQTIQPIGSISKTFIGAATARAIELGLFTLESPINDLLNMPLVNPNQPNAVIKVKHLVNHTSGLIDNDDAYLLSYYILPGEDNRTTGAQIFESFGITQRNPKTLEEFIKAYFYSGGDYYDSNNFSNNLPGSVETYSNTASSLMAYVIEKAANQSYKDFLTTEILNPLNMSNTSFDYVIPNPNYATLYYDSNTSFPFYGLESFPDGGLKSSNEDMMRYVLDMLAGARGESATFSKAFYQILFTNTSNTFSLFWIEGNESSFGHNGGDPGLTTELILNGDANTGLFMLSNYDNTTDEHEQYFYQIFGEILEEVTQFLEP